MNIENMKRMFPQFKITDASNRTTEQLSRIQKISAEVKNSFVFIKRNEKNAEFFIFYERIDNEVIGSYEYIILSVSHIHFIHKRNDYTSYLLHLKRLYNNEIQCVVCLEEHLKSFVYCNQCASGCCCECYYKIESDECPICRHKSFTKMVIEN